MSDIPTAEWLRNYTAEHATISRITASLTDALIEAARKSRMVVVYSLGSNIELSVRRKLLSSLAESGYAVTLVGHTLTVSWAPEKPPVDPE